MKHLMIITTSFPDKEFQPTLGEGAGAFVLEFARHLKKHLRITVVAPSGADKTEEIEGIVVKRFKVPRLPFYELKPGKAANWPDLARTLWAGRKALLKAVAADKPDHILAPWVLPCGWWARATKVPYSTWSIDSDFYLTAKFPIAGRLCRQVLQSAQARFGNSYFILGQLEEFCNLGSHFMPTTSPVSSGQNKEPKKEGPYRLAYLARWAPAKGTDILMEALELLTAADWAKIEEVRIHGAGPLEPLVRAKAQALRNQSRPVKDGQLLDRAGAGELLDWADYLIIGSRHESLPAVFSEALTNHTAIIANPAGDLPRLLNNYNVGELSPEAAPEPLARAISRALNSAPANYAPDFAKALSIFDLAKAAAEFIKITGLEN